MAGNGRAWRRSLGLDRCGLAVQARHGRRGTARLGSAGLGRARQGVVRQARHGVLGRGRAGPGEAWLGMARQASTKSFE
ncbi:MAG TPA: hypothetical protein VI703_06885 [Anaerolineales bacterium]|nr:hypothetical protein [Anaerolineales bacterium]